MKHRYSDRIRSSCLIIVLVGITVFGLRVVLVGPAAALGDAVAAAPASQALEARDQQASTQEAVRQLKQQGQYHSLMAAVQKARYSPQPVTQSSSPVKSASYSAANAGNGFRAWFAPEAVQVRPVNAGSGDWEWSVRLTGYGYGDRLQQPAQADPVVEDGRVEYRRGAMTEWYVNDPRGLEQGFTLAEPPPGRAESSQGRLTLRMAIADQLEPRLDAKAGAVKFVDPQGRVQLHYAGLKAWDAAGRELPSEMQASDGQIALLVDDRNASYPVTIEPLIFAETKLTASDAAAGDVFGISVAISGDTVVVGALGDDDAGTASGSGYVFVRTGSSWTQQQKLTASDAAADDVFGISVAISGDTVVVGARNDDDAGDASGSAYVFVRTGSSWTQQQKLTASDAAADDLFGVLVAISGDTVVVGADGDDDAGTASGSAYVFVRTGSSWTQQQQKLTASDAAAFDLFGGSVAISGDTVVVGADDAGGAASGSAHVYALSISADLMISLGVDKTNLRQGDLLTYTLTVRNFGPTRAFGVVVNDTLSSGTTFVSARANKGSFTGPPAGQTGTVTWFVGEMLNSDREDAQIQVTVIVRGRTTITNSATVGSYFTSDPNGANNSASITVSVSPGNSGKKN